MVVLAYPTICATMYLRVLGTLSGIPLQYRLLLALPFERGTVAKLSRENQAHRSSVKKLNRVDSQYVSPL